MLIKIDTREVELYNQIKILIESNKYFENIQYKYETLPIGDIILSEEVEIIIIERKSLADLSSSIKDSRYEEQSYRLQGSNYHNHNIIYLIEGDMNKLNFRIDKMTLYSAMFSLNYYKGFSVIRSFNLFETAFMICNMAYKLNKSTSENKQSFYKNKSSLDSSIQENEITENNNLNSLNNNIDIDINIDSSKICKENDYSSVIKKVKKDNITTDNIGSIMLCQIPGISSITANAIINEYKSLENLILHLKKKDSKFDELYYMNGKNQKRKINKTVIENLYKYLVS
jgi:ERCC4-type nuclease